MRPLSNMILMACVLVMTYMLSSQSVNASEFMSAPRAGEAVVTILTQVTLQMFELSGIGENTFRPCTSTNESKWGCTAYCDNGSVCTTYDLTKAYPWPSSTVTVQIDGSSPINRYLRDVVAQEMSPTIFRQSALTAQAIAARTYAYWHVRIDDIQPGTINNSNAYQIFIPYRYDTFSASERGKIDTALQQRLYMSYRVPYTVDIYSRNVNLSETDPIFAEFFREIPVQTIANPPFPYLLSVQEPISFHPDISQEGHGHGMSQRGAGRWARGSASYRCDPAPAPCDPAPNPLITPWSVTWGTAAQILTHYYTGVQIRDANNENAIVTPDYRWNALQLDMPTSGCRNVAPWVTITFQNTGTTNWDFGGYEKLSYSVTYLHPGFPLAAQSVEGIVPIPVPPSAVGTILPGESESLSFSIDTSQFGSGEGVYRVVFDMVRNGQTFASLATQSGKSWPTEEEVISMYDCVTQLYLPANQR